MYSSLSQNLPSIDTVVLGVRVDPQALSEFLPLSSHFSVCKPDGTLSRDSSRFYLWNCSREVESWWTPIVCWLQGEYLRVQLSLPKIYFGHSAGHVYLDKLPVVAAGLYSLLCSWGVPVVGDPGQILVNRLDIAYNFEIPSQIQAAMLYRGLTFCRYRGQNPHQRRNKTFAYWPSQVVTRKFYLKGPETEAHCLREGFYGQNAEELNRLLRYEEEWKLTQLKRYCQFYPDEHLYYTDITVFRVMRAFGLYWDTQQFFDNIHKNFVSRIATDPEKSLQYISIAVKHGALRPSSADQLYRFFSFTAESGRHAAKEHFGRNKYYNYTRKIRDLTGLDLDSQELNRGKNYIHSENLLSLNSDLVTTRFDHDYFFLNPFFTELHKHIRSNQVKDIVYPDHFSNFA